MRTRVTLLETEGALQTPVATRGPTRGEAMGRLRTVRRAAVAVEDGTILDVGTSARLRRKYPGARRTDLGRLLLLPGFVDAHNHLPFAGSRAFELDLKLAGASYLDILRRGGGIHRTVAATRRASLTQLVKACVDRLDVMLSSGTTTTEAKSGYGLRWRDERKQLLAVRQAGERHPVRLVPTFLGAHAVPRGVDRRAYVRDVVTRMVPAVAKERLARYCDVFLERGAFTRTEARRVLTAAARAGLHLKLHADEFSNRRGASLGVELGCTSVDHLLHIDPGGVRSLAASDTVAVLLPFVHRSIFESRTAPARRLVAAGAPVAIGTDFNPNCHNASMLEAFRAAVYDLKMRPGQALTAATWNAAWAVGQAPRRGAIRRGAAADLLAVDAEDVVDLAYRQGERLVRQVVVGGRRFDVTGRRPRPLPSP